MVSLLSCRISGMASLKKRFFCNKWYLALIGAGLLITGWAMHRFSNDVSDRELFTKVISERVKDELQVADETLQQLKQNIGRQKQVPLMSQVLSLGTHPLFVFENKELTHWSDYDFELDYQDIAHIKQEGSIEIKSGIFLVKRLLVQTTAQTEVDIVVLIPIYRNYSVDNNYVKNNLNPNIFGNTPADKVWVAITEEASNFVYGSKQNFMFSLLFDDNYVPNVHAHRGEMYLIISGLVLLLVWVYKNTVFCLKHRRSLHGLVWLVCSLLSIRLCITLMRFPQDFESFVVFEQFAFVETKLAPSLGDLFLNVLFAFCVLWYCYLFMHHILHIKHVRAGRWWSFASRILAATWAALTFLAAYSIHYLIYLVYQNQLISLDFTSSLSFSLERTVAIGIFVLASMSYFFMCHCVSRLFVGLGLGDKFDTVVAFFAGLAVTFVAFHTQVMATPLIAVLHAVFFFAFSLRKLPRTVLNYSPVTLQYIFVSAVVSTIIGVYSIYDFEHQRKIQEKQDLGNQILTKNDPFGEFMLTDAIEKIKQDKFIINRFSSLPSNSMDVVLSKIQRIHLGSYFDRYDVLIHLYGSDNTPKEPFHGQSYDSLLEKYSKAEYKTNEKNVYLVKDLASSQRRYYAFINLLNSDEDSVGKIVIELQLRRIFPNSVYPSLIIDKVSAPLIDKPDWSYAIFANNELLYSSGNFSYEPDFMNMFATEILSGNEIFVQDHRHLRVSGTDGRELVITSPGYPLKSSVFNAPFLFLPVFLLMLFSSLSYYFFVRRQKFKFSFTVRVQSYVNVGFIVPCAALSIIILSMIGSNNKENTQERFFREAENVAQNITQEVSDYVNNRSSNDKLQQVLAEIARYSQTDINLYGIDGRLVVASQSAIYNNNLLSKRINPSAYAQIKENNQNRAQEAESIGSLKFNSVYVSIKSFETGQLIGILSLPFFQSQKTNERQYLNVVAIIVNVFTWALILLLALSYFLSSHLTKPLTLITEKLRDLTLGKPNKPLDYNSSDEIGRLINEYNNMIIKLDASQTALAQKEKESAWREMAKQVAHEIKNPLTPMKLTLQHLQRIVEIDNETTKRYFNTLLDQIDTLSDISSSFAAFAIMPIPKEEVFDVAKVLHQTVILYRSAEAKQINLNMPEGDFFVNADSKLMGRIFSNLIVNAIQAAKPNTPLVIDIILETDDLKTVRILFKDNGKGVSLDTQKKIFLPYFTTKTTGSGIGLAVAKRGIEHAKGQIWVESEEGEGSVFHIELPLVKKEWSKETPN